MEMDSTASVSAAEHLIMTAREVLALIVARGYRGVDVLYVTNVVQQLAHTTVTHFRDPVSSVSTPSTPPAE